MKEPSNIESAVVPIEADIKSRILTIRGVQVMLANDLADLYHVTTSAFNQSVKRNEARFPSNFRFQLSPEEMREVITNCDNPDRYRFSPRATYAFTEQGVAMLSGVLKSDIAVQVSIRIMDAFVSMRRALASIAPLLNRIETVERRQIADQSRNEKRFTEIFDAMNAGKFPPQKIFFKGMPEDAHSFIIKLIKKARKTIVLVDGYVDDVTLDILAKKRGGVKVTIATHPKTSVSAVDVDKFNEQYPTLTLRKTSAFHDRFLVIDDRLYHVGASLKDVGRLCFAVAELDAMFIPLIMQHI